MEHSQIASGSGNRALQGQTATSQPVPTLAVIAGILSVGLLAGLLVLSPSLAVSAIAVAAVGLGLPLFLVIWSRPEFGLLLLVLLTSGLVPVDAIDLRLPIGGGFDMRDLALLGMLGLLSVQGLLRHRLQLPWPAVSLPLLLFTALALFSTVYARVYHGVEPHWIFAELRSESFLLTFFIVGWAIVRRYQLTVILIGLYVIADLTAAAVILQQFLGADHPLLAVMSGSSWHLWQQDATSSGFGALRIIPPGHVLMYFTMLISLCLMLFVAKKTYLRAAFGLQLVYLNIALLLTYTRAQWIAAVLAAGIIIIVLIRDHKAQVFRYAVAGSLALLLGYGLLGARLENQIEQVPFVNTLTVRALSVFSPGDTLQSYSLEWRQFEAEQALRSIAAHPLLGVGLGNSYRGITTLQGEAIGAFSVNGLAAGDVSRLTRFIHSSPLYIAVKMGLPALFVFVWFSAAFLVRGWSLHERLSDPLLKSVVLAILAGYVGLLQWSLFHELLVVLTGTVLVGLTSGLVASIQETEGYTMIASESKSLVPRPIVGGNELR